MSVFATIDVGTNSMKLFVGEVPSEASGTGDAWPQVTRIAEGLEITRLGEGLAASGRLSEDAIARNAAQLCSFVNQARQHGATRIVIVGTMALREATNAAEFLERVRGRCDIDVEVLPGREEARLGFLAVLSGMRELPGRTCVFDTGGGSTEFMVARGQDLEESFSLNIGVRAPTEDHLLSDPPRNSELSSLREKIARDLRRAGETMSTPAASLDRVIGMGGTVTTLAAVKLGMTRYDPEAIQGTLLGRDELERQIALYARLPLLARQEIDGLAPKRADVILAGACIVAAVLDELKKSELIVSSRGLRHGLFYDRFASAN